MLSDAGLETILGSVLTACETDATLRTAVKRLAERATRAIARLEANASPSDPRRGPAHGADLEGSRPLFGERRWGREARDGTPDAIDFEVLERRLRLKADGARWAAVRRRRLSGADVDDERDVEQGDREIFRRAKEIPGCILWFIGPGAPEPADLASFQTLAACFDNAAAAVDVVRTLDAAGEAWISPKMVESFRLLAEAQSALRIAVTDFGETEDFDQYLLFSWLKANTRDRAIYVARHMRRDDPADPGNWPHLSMRLAAFAASAVRNGR